MPFCCLTAASALAGLLEIGIGSTTIAVLSAKIKHVAIILPVLVSLDGNPSNPLWFLLLGSEGSLTGAPMEIL